MTGKQMNIAIVAANKLRESQGIPAYVAKKEDLPQPLETYTSKRKEESLRKRKEKHHLPKAKMERATEMGELIAQKYGYPLWRLIETESRTNRPDTLKDARAEWACSLHDSGFSYFEITKVIKRTTETCRQYALRHRNKNSNL